jgi:D-3-phosphoglycerate dehydrogenase
MSDAKKRVFYVRNLAHQEYATAMARRPDIQFDKLENDSADEVAAPIRAGAHAYQIGSARDELAPRFHATRDLLRKTQSLLVISTNGAGYDTVNVDDCTDAGVLVVNQSGGNAEAVAEHVMGLLLALSKRIGETDHVMRRSGHIERAQYAGNDVLGKTIGIIGIGNVGRRVAELCRGLFRMRVLAYDPYVSAEEAKARGAEKVELADLLSQADYVSINCPLTSETRGMMGTAQYALMQPHAYFITTARGHIHDEAALADALRAKKIAGAGLDVWSKEPPPSDHPLMAFDNVLVSPHTAGITKETRAHMGRIAAAQLLDALDGKRPPRIVNPQVWPVYAARFKETFGVAPQ